LGFRGDVGRRAHRRHRRGPLRPALRKVVFVDTSFWIAARLRRETGHANAVRLLKAHEDRSLVTTDFVRGETWTLLRRRDGHKGAVSYLDMLAATPRIRVELVGERLQTEALAWLRRHDE